MSLRIFAFAAVCTLAGCVSKPIVTVQQNVPPLAPSRFILADSDGEIAALPAVDSARLVARFAAHGWSNSDGDGAGERGKSRAAILVIAAIDRRPAKVGLLSRHNPQDKSETPLWAEQPDRRRKSAMSVTLRYLDASTGVPLRVVHARALHGKRTDPGLIDRLINAAITGEDSLQNRAVSAEGGQ